MAELTLFHIHQGSMGYGRLGVELTKALQGMGIDVYDDQPKPPEFDLPHERNEGSRSKSCNVVAWVSVPGHARGYWENQYRCLFSMWEAQRLPESFRENLDVFDLVVVPSHHNVELFSRYHGNVAFSPLGIDPLAWRYVPRLQPEFEFRFLVAGSGPRKGTDLAFDAFRKLWPSEGSWGSGPAPYLVMKNPRRERFGGPRVEVIGGKIPARGEIDLYSTAHCYLGPARGEGFGLQPLQAMAQGCPTILTAAHGHDSFAHLGLGISARPAPAAYFVYGDAGDWWEPDLDELCDRMRWVYDNYADAVAQAAAASQVIHSEFTWARTAERFVDAIGLERLEVPFTTSDRWVVPEQRKYLVVTNRDVFCEIGGISYQFKRGVECWERADVKRVLFENGSLDPACLDQEDPRDSGLAPEQLPEVANYSAAHSFCQTCGQQLNSRPTRADMIEEEMRGA